MCSIADGVTGFGVSSFKGDNEHNIMEVCHETQKVRELDKTGYFNDPWEKNLNVLREWTFQEYVDANLREEEAGEDS